jgi:hypothetical protein
MSDNRTNNMRDIINSVRDLQDLGDVINGRNVYNININYYENYNNSTNNDDDNDESVILSDDESLILSEEGKEEVLDDIDSAAMDTESISSDESNTTFVIRTDISCPSNHLLEFKRESINNTIVKCSGCNIDLNSEFYKCSSTICNYIICRRCVDSGLFYRRSHLTYNPDNYLSHRYNTSVTNNYSTSQYSVTDLPLNYSNSTTTLPGLNDLSSIIGNSISDTITNTIGDIINSETVQNNMGNEAITVTIGEIGSLIPRGITIKDLIEKTQLKISCEVDNSDNKCHICNEDYSNLDICRIINNCSHHYHSQCIDNWLVNNINCPICNQNI